MKMRHLKLWVYSKEGKKIMGLIPKFYMEAVISIGIRIASDIKWIGTGFFVIKKMKGREAYLPFMVTNRHVIENNDTIVIRLKEKDTGELKIIDMPVVDNGKKLYSTSSDLNIDIAVASLNGSYIITNNLEFAAFDIDEHAVSSSEFLTKGGDEGTYIYMLGFPMGLVNVDSNAPICRGGCVARIDSKEIKKTKNILLDIQNFPGNSGSPIISKPEIVGIEGEPVLNKSVLIGIIHGYLPYKESLINSQTHEIVEIRSENSGIAVANPTEFIRMLVDKEICRAHLLPETEEPGIITCQTPGTKL